ncbi:glycosyltransferase family 4 protein [Promicromonospora sp. NPDC090134]|uniref:glycosyltransferase family 4 protein n=1 Tax=Promicromonospora sp. NPDC090134 TaxID=3364408 RepID=UPI0038079D8B
MPQIYPFPYWTTNPYLNMLYLEARAQGWQARGRWRYGELIDDLGRLAPGDIAHVHWTGPISDGVLNAADFRVRINTLDAALGRAAARGVRLFWTVHNTVAHDAKYLAEEVELAKVLARRAEKILVLNSQTVTVAAEHYEIPVEKVHRIPHASYLGIYPQPHGRRAVRESLGIPLGERVVGIVGGLRPYKGVGVLLRAAGLLAERHPNVSLLLAGKTDPAAMREIEEALPPGVTVYRRHAELTEDEVVTWSAACDVLAFPYTRILNSGSMLLASTMGVPCVVPALPHLMTDYGDQAWVEFFDAEAEDRPAALAAAVERCFDRQGGARTRAAKEFAAAYTMHDMAADFAELLHV